jgi:DNA repair protein RadC
MGYILQDGRTLTVSDVISEMKTEKIDAGNPQTVARKYRGEWHKAHREYFAIVGLNVRGEYCGRKTLFSGSIASSTVYPREVAYALLKMNACAVILLHNHPSGIATPSNEDRVLTRVLTDTLHPLSISVFDHFIIGATAWYSMTHNQQREY